MSKGPMGTGPTSGRGIFSIGARAPLEIRVAASLLVGGAALFLLVGLLRLSMEGGGADSFTLLPMLVLVVAIGVAGGLLRGMRSARLFGLVFVLLVALLHASVALQSFPLWVRIVAVVLAASQVYVAVLLNTRPALLHSGGARP